ncbi:hypothetical protein AB0I54_46760 [Streptomyces sp. NPDC050625]|uniref:hypothetical protein n=1 Tax=Streptomyces sp. NPDC050625 TaxID=3154629 RepID=UPI00342872B8
MANEILPLVGVAVGAATSFLVTSLNERTKWRREQSVRWDAQRLTAYAEYARLVSNAQRIAVARGLTVGPHPLEPTPEALDRLGSAEVHRTALSEALLLLGDRHTIATVKRMNQYLWQLEQLARAIPDQGDSGGSWDQTHEAYRTARQEYIDRARRSLGVTGSARISP